MATGSNPENRPQSLPRVCLSHMHNTAGRFLHRLVHSSIKSTLFRREVEQLGAAERDRKGLCSGDHVILFTAPQPLCQLLSPQTLSTSLPVCFTCMTVLFHQEIFFFFFQSSEVLLFFFKHFSHALHLLRDFSGNLHQSLTFAAL